MTAPDRAALGERAARALQSALGEPLAKVLERVTVLLVAVDEEAARRERDRCVSVVMDMRRRDAEYAKKYPDVKEDVHGHAEFLMLYSIGGKGV